MYIVQLDWYDEDLDNWEEIKTTNLFLEDCSKAIHFAHDVAYKKDMWEAAGQPCGVYVFEVDRLDYCVNDVDFIYDVVNDNTKRTYTYDMNNTYLVAYPQCQKYLHH